MSEEFRGQVERIVFESEEDGYCVIRLRVEGRKEPVTAVGNFAAISPGEIIAVKGDWVQHQKYGRQLKVNEIRWLYPATVKGIEKYLGSGLIKGIGPVMAKRIVAHFREKTLEIIEKQIDRLKEIGGIGDVRIKMIQGAWNAQKEIRYIMMFLQEHNIGPSVATKIYKQYGQNALEIVKKNPYQLSSDIHGIGFKRADDIAQKLGIEKTSPERIKAGVKFILNQMTEQGHVFAPYGMLLESGAEMLEVDRELVSQAIADTSYQGAVVIEDINSSLENNENSTENNKACYLKPFFVAETGIAKRMKKLLESEKSVRVEKPEAALEWAENLLALNLAEEQSLAVKKAITSNILVITGGPGTGKTTIISFIINILHKKNARINLGAPTGRAAKRLSEATGMRTAKTIHRLLEFNAFTGGFSRNDKNPLETDVVIIDEMSMIDTILMYHLVKAIPDHAVLILVGDVNQLPSVGPGNVLNDIISSGTFPVVRLTKIFRQAQESLIVVNAHRINQGFIPWLKKLNQETLSDFYFISQEDPASVVNIILELVNKRIPERFGFDPIEDIQVLVPMHQGIAGIENINSALQNVLNSNTDGISRAGKFYKAGDKVMQIKNNYTREVFNGDIGRIRVIDKENQEMMINFDGRDLLYDFADLDEVVPAYAISIHKSQGSEYPVVVIPILTQHFILLQRNLVYTAITRGKKLVVLVGTVKALSIAVRNNKTQKRFTMLKRRLNF